MKPLFLTLASTLMIAGISCTPTQKSAATGAAGGAILGSIIADGENHKKGAIIGATAGAVAGIAVESSRRKKAQQGDDN